jgi:hypothetical protein
VDSALYFLNGGHVDLAAASALKIDGPPGFFLATDADVAMYFAARRPDRYTVVEFQIPEEALAALTDAGAQIRPIPQGAAAFPFRGQELVVTAPGVEAFNTMLDQGVIRVIPHRR